MKDGTTVIERASSVDADKIDGITLIIPAYNEAEGIVSTLGDISKISDQVRYSVEIIVVDDGSTDTTGKIARELGARVISHPKNSGYGRALITGIENSTYNTVVIIDADGTYPVEAIVDIVRVYKKGFDMVVGARKGKHYSRNFRSLVLRKLFRFLAEFSCGESIPDINSGLRIFDREKALSLREFLSTGFSFTTTITLLFFLNHYFVGYFPIEYRQRIGKSHVHFFRDSLRSLQIIVTVIAQYNPLKLYLLQLITLLSGYTVIALLYVLGPLQQPIYWQLGSIGWSALNIITALAITTTAFMGRQKPEVLRSTL